MLLDDLQTQRLGLGTQRRGLSVLLDDLQTQRLGPWTQRRGLLIDSLYLCSQFLFQLYQRRFGVALLSQILVLCDQYSFLARQPLLSAALAFL